MATYLVHVYERVYRTGTAVIEAESEQEAREKYFEEDPTMDWDEEESTAWGVERAELVPEGGE
jgi:hypothetical protein